MKEAKEIQEARALQVSLTSRRKEEQRPPDFKPLDIDALDEHIPGIKDAFSGEEGEKKSCEHCGAVLTRLSIKHPIKKGRFFHPWPMCECRIKHNEIVREREERMERKRRLQRTYARNIMAEALVNARFENWVPREGTEKPHKRALDFCSGFETAKAGLLFFGSVGNGKSHLARSIERRLDEMGYATLFLDFRQFAEMARSSFGGSSNVTVHDYITAAILADLLVLDEIGAGVLTDWEFKSLLLPIINGRSGKKTIYTTNLDPANFSPDNGRDSQGNLLDDFSNWFAFDKNGNRLDEAGRLVDRIIGDCDLVKNSGSSRRRELAMERMKASGKR